jgi:HK97 gp10 family phage protein
MAMKGRESLLRKLKAIQGKPRKAMRQALETGAGQVVATAKNFVPVADGDLRDSIGYTFGNYAPDNANVRGVSAGGGGDPDLSVTIHAGNAKAFYAAFVEFGTSPHDAGGLFKGAEHPGTTAQPFFYPAYRANKRSVKSRITRAMKKAIKEDL